MFHRFVVIIKAIFHSNLWPNISGADMTDDYAFESMSFRWGFSDASGSEHTINNRSFPLELQVSMRMSQQSTWIIMLMLQQVIHVMRKEKLRYLVISYLYRITNCDNPYMDPVILNLPRITRASTVPVHIDPFPLAWLAPPVRTGFFSYGGSLTCQPQITDVTWLVHAEPLAISRSQMEQFRNLRNHCGQRMVAHRRPVQPLNDRVVCFNKLESKHTFPYNQ